MLTADRARHLFDYDPETGVLTWRCPTKHSARLVGQRAGSVNSFHRHREVKADGRLYREHRVIWLHVHGEWPKQTIDHINGDPADNRLANLRDVDMRAQQQNKVNALSTNRVGVLGVHVYGDRYRAQIGLDGRLHYLGTFDTVAEAQAAYLAAKRLMHAYSCRAS